MQPTPYPTRFRLGHRAGRRAQCAPHRGLSSAQAGPRSRLAKALRGLPRRLHAAPYVALALLGAVLLIPGVVPHGPACGNSIGAASLTERRLFIDLSAVAFGLVVALLLLSALAASAQRRSGRPGRPTIASCVVLGVVTLAAMISPHAPLAAPAQAAMMIDVLGLLVTQGAALAIPAVAGAVAWAKLSGSQSLRAAQISAWTVLLLGLPLIMALTYLTVTPICLD